MWEGILVNQYEAITSYFVLKSEKSLCIFIFYITECLIHSFINSEYLLNTLLYKCLDPEHWAPKDAMKSWETHINLQGSFEIWQIRYNDKYENKHDAMKLKDLQSHSMHVVCLKPFSHHFNFVWKAWDWWGEVELCSRPITVSKETISIKYLSHLPILKYYWEICWTENHKADLQLLPADVHR